MRVLFVGGAPILQQDILLTQNIHVKYVTCGRPNCSCILGRKHGPYYYARKRIDGKYRDKYVSLKSRPSINFKFEIVGKDVILDIDDLSEIPSVLSLCSAFVLAERIR